MPIIDVDLIGETESAPSLSAELAQAIGAALGVPTGRIWLTLRRRPGGDYAENGPPPEPLPVFVRVLARRAGELVDAQQARAIANAAAAVLARPPERVHVIFEPDARGRVFFGGQPGPG